MAEIKHLGKESPPVTIESRPDAYLLLINTHGVASRILQARKCPCILKTGSPDMYCALCNGDGFRYGYQRKLLRVDEDSDIEHRDGSVIKPFFVPVLEPVSVERLAAPIQGGIKKYQITGFDDESIFIKGNPLPRPWEKRRVSYYFDRFNHVKGDRLRIDGWSAYTTRTRFDGQHRAGNVQNAHGDIQIIERIYNIVTGYEYKQFTFIKNRIQFHSSQPALVQGEIVADYYYAPCERTLPADIDPREEKEAWSTMLQSQSLRVAVAPWWELASGDMITFMTVEFFRDDIIVHSVGRDKIPEFDVVRLDDQIIDENGTIYLQHQDFILDGFHDIRWIGRQPAPGAKFSVRHSYRPTYVIYKEQAVPNRMENRTFPMSFTMHLYSKTLQRDSEQQTPQTVFPTPPQIAPGSMPEIHFE